MNVGKILATIAVLAIIVYCCWGAVSDAVPKDVTTLSEPVDGLDSMDMSVSQDGLNVNVTIKGDLTNNLPQDLVDVGVTLYLGSGDEKMKLAEVIKTLTAGTSVSLNETVKVPVYAIIAYTANITESEDGGFTLPLCTKIDFKYFEWMDEYLVDMSMTIKTDMPIDGLSAPEISKVDENNAVQVKMTTSEGIIHELVSGLDSAYKNVKLTCGAASFGFEIVGDDITLVVAGDETDDAVTILKKEMKNNDGKLSFVYDGKNYELDKEQSESLLNVFNEMYAEASA